MNRFAPGDSVEVIAPCAYVDEVGRVMLRNPNGTYKVRFGPGDWQVFHPNELRLSQQKLPLEAACPLEMK